MDSNHAREDKIARLITATAISESTRYAMRRLESAIRDLQDSLDRSVPQDIRDRAGVIASYARDIRSSFDRDEFQDCINDLARLRGASTEYSGKLSKWIEKVFPEYKRQEMRDKYEFWYNDGTHFEECLKQEIQWQVQDKWKTARDLDGAAGAIAGSIKRLMMSYNVGETISVDLKAYGYPDRFRFTASVWRSAEGNRSQIDCKAFDAKTNRGASCEPFYSNIKYDDGAIREQAEWMLKHIEGD